MKIQTIIVDDEKLAREKLKQMLLKHHEDVELIGEASNGEEGAELVMRTNPDLVFLDIEMPGLNGFGMLSSLSVENLPLVVFATAFDEFAVKAFEVHALDYLLKPFDQARLTKAMNRVRTELGKQEKTTQSKKLTSLLSEVKGRGDQSGRLAIKADGKIVLVKAQDISWIESSDNYVEIHALGMKYLVRETMNSIESRLTPEKFIRVSRSAIVNVEMVKELQPLFHGDYVITLTTGAKVNLTRSHKDKLQFLLGG